MRVGILLISGDFGFRLVARSCSDVDDAFMARRIFSVQFKIVAMRLEKPICAPPRLSDVSPAFLLKQSD